MHRLVCSRRLHTAWLVLSLWLGGCADRGASAGEGESETGEAGAETETGEAPQPSSCGQVCAELKPDSCLRPEDCASYCVQESPAWSLEIGEAYAVCVATNSLCYESIEGCMLNALHPAGSEHAFVLEGVGFDDYEGLEVYLVNELQLETTELQQTVLAGQFSFAWSVEYQPFDTAGPLVMYYIDVNSDDSCSPDTDWVGSGYLEWNGELATPSFLLELSPMDDSSPGICNSFP